MPSGHGERYDFFLSRRGSVAAIAQEVADVLIEKGYKVFVQDYSIPLAANLIEEMHEGIKNSRDLVVLFTLDYEQSPYTRMEFTSFEANAAQSAEKRRMVILRCEDAPLLGLLAPHVYQNLVGINDPEERKSRILAAAEGRSQALPPPPRPFISVSPRIASFTGRAEELQRLDAILMQDKPAAVTQTVGRAAVEGMGGVGKTSLAVEYAYRFRGLYAGVCWCPAETRTGLLSALATLAVTLGVATTEEADVELAAKAALRRLAEQRATWLLIYDNVPAPDEIADLLPSSGARVLITSRFSDWSELADEIALDVLALEEAVALLQNRAGRGDAEGARALAEALGCLPLALDHAAAYCKRTQTEFRDYAQRASGLISTAPRGAGYPRSVAVTFDLAITDAAAQCRAVEPLIAYLAQCAPERIPMTLIEGAIEDEEERLQALAALAEVSLVKHDPFEDTTPAVSLHRLVLAVARPRSEANGSAQSAVERLLARLLAIYPTKGYDDPQTWPNCAHLTPHVLAQRDSAKEATSETEDWADLLNRVGTYFHGRGSYAQAAPLLRDALAIRKKVLGPEHVDMAMSANNLALLLKDQGDFRDARLLYLHVVRICKKAFGPKHPTTATSLNNLAGVLNEEGALARARLFYERALVIYEGALGPNDPDTAMTCVNLAIVVRKQGDPAAARIHLERALKIYEDAFRPDHPAISTTLNNLAILFMSQGDFAGARPLLERVVRIDEKVRGIEHPATATSLSNLARAFQGLGDVAEAQLIFERVLAIRETRLGPEHPSTNTARCNLARLLLSVRLPEEALTLSETALIAHQKRLGPSHVRTKESARVASGALDALGRTEEAKALRARYGLTEPEKPNTHTGGAQAHEP